MPCSANDNWRTTAVPTTLQTLADVWGVDRWPTLVRFAAYHARRLERRAEAFRVVREAEERTRDAALLVRLRRAAEAWIQEEDHG